MLAPELFHQKILYISEYQLLNLENILIELQESYHYKAELLSPPKKMIIIEEVEIPIRMKVELHFQKGFKLNLTLIESNSREFRFYNQKFKLIFYFTENVEEILNVFYKSFIDKLDKTISDKFISMEHLRFFLKDPYSMIMFSLPENLLLSAWNAVFKLFKKYNLKGEVAFETKSHSPEKVRIEVADKVYKYADVNIFQIFEKDNIVFAF